LRTDRKLLKNYNPSGFARVGESELLAERSNPKFFTHHWKAKKGAAYLFVYDFGF